MDNDVSANLANLAKYDFWGKQLLPGQKMIKHAREEFLF